MEFHPAPFRPPHRAFAAMAFPWRDGQVLLADIPDRGWCIPSGRVEAGESGMEAALREAREEAGAVLAPAIYLGAYKLIDGADVRWAEVFAGVVDGLQEIDPEFESRGRRWTDPGELSELYHEWNGLIEAVFAHSRTMLIRHIRLLQEEQSSEVQASGSSP